jgi:hypothetical protein
MPRGLNQYPSLCEDSAQSRPAGLLTCGNIGIGWLFEPDIKPDDFDTRQRRERPGVHVCLFHHRAH